MVNWLFWHSFRICMHNFPRFKFEKNKTSRFLINVILHIRQPIKLFPLFPTYLDAIVKVKCNKVLPLLSNREHTMTFCMSLKLFWGWKLRNRNTSFSLEKFSFVCHLPPFLIVGSELHPLLFPFLNGVLVMTRGEN